ncbi:hypothetical protein LguiA_016401 [Lonicera macranthoides]
MLKIVMPLCALAKTITVNLVIERYVAILFMNRLFIYSRQVESPYLFYGV